jgi:hypothetical protein
MTKREIRYIRKEVTEYFGLKKLSNTCSVEGIFLLKAVSAIAGGLDEQSTICVMEDVGKKGAAALIPELNHIKATGLWKSDLLTCVEPDILAADFLSYALQKICFEK